MTPLPWYEAVSDFPHLQIAQFKGKRRALDEHARQHKGKGPAQSRPRPREPQQYPPMFRGTSQGLFEECCNEVANQLAEASQNVEKLEGFQDAMDKWKLKLECHILKHREFSGVLQREISDRQAKVEAISDDIKQLEAGLTQADSWSQLIKDTLSKVSENKEKEKKMAQAAEILASLGDFAGSDEQEILTMAKRMIKESKEKDPKASESQASGAQASEASGVDLVHKLTPRNPSRCKLREWIWSVDLPQKIPVVMIFVYPGAKIRPPQGQTFY